MLCVKEGKKVSHYIINREDQGYRIGIVRLVLVIQDQNMFGKRISEVAQQTFLTSMFTAVHFVSHLSLAMIGL